MNTGQLILTVPNADTEYPLLAQTRKPTPQASTFPPR